LNVPEVEKFFLKLGMNIASVVDDALSVEHFLLSAFSFLKELGFTLICLLMTPFIFGMLKFVNQ